MSKKSKAKVEELQTENERLKALLEKYREAERRAEEMKAKGVVTVRLLRGSYADEDVRGLNDGRTVFNKGDVFQIPQAKYDAYMLAPEGKFIPGSDGKKRIKPNTPMRTRVHDSTLWFEKVS